MKKNIILIDHFTYPRNFRKHLIKLAAANYTILSGKNRNEIKKKIVNAHAIINCPRKFFDRDLLQNASSLEWVHSGGAGVDEYLFPEFIDSDITLTNGKILQGPEIADHAIGLLLSISRNIYLYVKGDYKKIRRPIELNKKRCAILGLGGIGLCIAERLKTFGMKIIGFSEELVPLVSFIDEAYRGNELIKYIKDMDVVICAAPLTKKTHKIFNYKMLSKMKKNSIFINVSRGELVDTNALLKNKINSKFLGIGLDVTNPEPVPKNHKLKKLKNIILTNHSAGLSDKNRERAKNLMLENIKRFCNGTNLLNIVNKKEGY